MSMTLMQTLQKSKARIERILDDFYDVICLILEEKSAGYLDEEDVRKSLFYFVTGEMDTCVTKLRHEIALLSVNSINLKHVNDLISDFEDRTNKLWLELMELRQKKEITNTHIRQFKTKFVDLCCSIDDSIDTLLADAKKEEPENV